MMMSLKKMRNEKEEPALAAGSFPFMTIDRSRNTFLPGIE